MPPPATTTDPRFAQIESHRPYLMRYALASCATPSRPRKRSRRAWQATTPGLDDLFDATGHWRQAPQAWGDPEAALERRRFREDTEVICKDEGITASNCWVILHRSRLPLRACLEKNWFGKEAARGG